MGRISSTGILETYLSRLHEIHHSRHKTPELSYRGALENLLAAVGQSLDPAVHPSAELPDTGAGRPDFGLVASKSDSLRCVVETKPFSHDIPLTADGAQVSKYYNHYRVVLVTNYRDFLLVTTDNNRQPRVEDRFQLTADEESFWRTPAKNLADLRADSFLDFLTGVLRRDAPILRPRDLAQDLARYAREAKRRLDRADPETLAPLQSAMESALGLHFSGDEGQHFFRSSLVQTLFYGLFSGWMLWRQGKHQPHEFAWKDASDHLALPLIGNLFDEIAKPRRLTDLNLREPLEWATSALNRVDETEFFNKFDQDHAITLFYEPFLQAFDPELRKQLGVWYTPPEIVQYMVGRVHQLLQSELNIPDGLADENVYILDPACGTGSYLVEVAKVIHQTLIDQGHGSLSASKVKKALTSRVFGFEILPAPYVVSHLQLGVLLREMKTKLAPDERAGVFLTNALTGWEPPKGAKKTLPFQFLQEEQEAATKVKQEKRIIVILGNPPYNGYAGVAQDEEADLIEPYKTGLYEKWGISKNLLDDLYIRFFRLAERQVGTGSPRGIVAFISNYSWLDGLSHPVMREHILERFDLLIIDNCNGDKYRTGKRTSDGRPDQSMFTTDQQPIGIQIGTAVTTMVKRAAKTERNLAECHYRELWGMANEKRGELLATLTGQSSVSYVPITPVREQRFVLAPPSAHPEYSTWFSLDYIFAKSVSGIVSRRDEFVVDIDRDRLLSRVREYLDPAVSDNQIAEHYPRVMEDGSGFEAAPARRELIKRGYDSGRALPFYFRPFDMRWIYYEPTAGLVNAASPRFKKYLHTMSLALEARQKIPTLEWDRGFVVSTLADSFGNGCSVYFTDTIINESLHGEIPEPNVQLKFFSEAAAHFGFSLTDPKTHHFTKDANQFARQLFFHLLAILWSPAYRKENEAALRQDWPRVPIPADPKLLESSAALGRQVADLLLPDKPVPRVTTGKLRPELKHLAIPSKIDGTPIEEPADTKVTAGWGFRGQKNAVMCGKGKVLPRGTDYQPVSAISNDSFDLYINETTFWKNVPADVYAMTIGGYPVIKKWLSYREHKVLGRPLRSEELEYITHVVRRLKALLLLGPDLDANYRAAAAAPQLSIKPSA